MRGRSPKWHWYTGDESHNPNNNRPNILILSCVTKVYEKSIYNQLYAYITVNKVSLGLGPVTQLLTQLMLCAQNLCGRLSRFSKSLRPYPQWHPNQKTFYMVFKIGQSGVWILPNQLNAKMYSEWQNIKTMYSDLSKWISLALGERKLMWDYALLETSEIIYNGLIQLFDYCDIVWDGFNKTLAKRLQRLKNRAAWIITRSSDDVRSADILKI